jgi:hypothetical protein
MELKKLVYGITGTKKEMISPKPQNPMSFRIMK